MLSCPKKQPSKVVVLNKEAVNHKDTTDGNDIIKQLKLAFLDSAYQYEKNQQFEQAIVYYKKASDYYRSKSKWDGYIWTLNKLGYCYTSIHKIDRSGYYLNQALNIALAKIPEQKNLLGYIYYSFGWYYDERNDPEKLIESFNKALKYWNYHGFKTYFCYLELGCYYLRIFNDYKKAHEYFLKALKIEENDPKPDKRHLANCYYYIAIVNNNTGDFAKADSYIHQAINLNTSIKSYGNLEADYAALGILQYDMERYDRAIENYKIAIELNVDHKGDILNLAYYFSDIAGAYMKNGQLSEAIRYYKKAIPLLQNNDVTSVLGLNDVYVNMGEAYRILNMKDSTVFVYHKCINVISHFFNPNHPVMSGAYKSIGEFYEENNQLDSALHYFQLVIIANSQKFKNSNVSMNPTFAQIGFSASISEILEHKADVLMQLYRLNRSNKRYLLTAMNSYGLCDSLMTRHKQILEYENSKLRFNEFYHKVYEKYLACIFEIYTITKNDSYISFAQYIMEKNKAELLQSALKQTEALNSFGIPDSVREKMETLNRKIIHLEKSKSENNAATQKNEIQKEIFDTRRNLEKFKEYLEKEFPVYFKYKYQTNQQSLNDIRKLLTNCQELIEYFQGDSSIYAIAVTKEKSLFVKFKHDQKLDTLIAAFQKTISINPDFTSLETNYQLFVKYSFQLYNILVRNLIARKDRRVPEIKQLIIIPDGLFSLIPFEALIDTFPNQKQSDFKNLPYLIKSYTISYGHSTYMIFNKMGNRKPPLSNVLAFSEAKTPSDSPVLSQNPLSLYGTASELNEVHKYMDGTFFYGKNATESKFKSLAPNYKIIHLALHGGADVKNPGNSKIFFTSGGDNEDGILFDYELYALQLKANLTILSACETGVGKYYKGEGIYNMGRGFIYAGCPAVVMSYWKINDRITANQIGYFYQNLKEKRTVNSALRMAKLEYLSHSDNITAHPVNWASLNAWGKTDMLIEKDSKVTTCLFAGGFLIALMLIFKNRRKLKDILFNFL